MPTQQVTSNNYYIYNTPQAMISLILISKQNSLQKGEKTKRKKEKKANLCLCFGDWTASASLVSQLSKQSKKNSSILFITTTYSKTPKPRTLPFSSSQSPSLPVQEPSSSSSSSSSSLLVSSYFVWSVLDNFSLFCTFKRLDL
jgi:hypothetical protein